MYFLVITIQKDISKVHKKGEILMDNEYLDMKDYGIICPMEFAMT